MVKKLFFTLLALCLVFGLSAQENSGNDNSSQAISYAYDTGDQQYSLSIAPFINLFMYVPSEIPQIVTGSMNLGGYISLGWDAFYNHKSSVGLELGYGFATSLDKQLYVAIPVLAKATYFIVEGEVDLPVSIGIGGIYNSYQDQHYFGPVIKPEVGVFWNANPEWGIGIKSSYWFIPEIYFGADSGNTAYANFLTINLAVKFTQ